MNLHENEVLYPNQIEENRKCWYDIQEKKEGEIVSGLDNDADNDF